MKDLSKTVGRLSDKQKEKVFGNGKKVDELRGYISKHQLM